MKWILALSIYFGGLSVNAQTIPNAGMENWVYVASPDFHDEIISWLTPYSGIPFYSTVAPDSDSYSGNFAARIKVIGTNPGQAGYMALASADRKYVGIPFTLKPSQLNAWIKSGLIAPDSLSIFVYLTRWNSSTGQKDLVGSGLKKFGGTSTAYAQVHIPLSYDNASGIPDSLFINIMIGDIFNAPGYTKTPGSYLLIDDLSFTGSTGVANNVSASSVHIYPNPAGNKLKIDLQDAPANIRIIDISGQVQYSGTSVSIDLDGWCRGLYFIEVRAKDESLLRQKLIIE